MLRRIAALTLFSVALTGCSYSYDIIAVVRDGQLVFDIDPKSEREPSCLRQVEVLAREQAKAEPGTGDDINRVGYGTFWFESVDYQDDCSNRFPLPYGATLKGQLQADLGRVAPKPLLREVVYEVSTTTGATGYGGGCFIIRTDGRVENLARGCGRPDLTEPA